ncbi:hypothetical protein GCM10022239_26580 [Leifsonia bigeumensis]|uniref:Trehalose 6-phosphate phosphatase n=1 Tax=Leifsonella bigeumensis TaxID=433643 RepID=A0ABP7FXK5_9MICO
MSDSSAEPASPSPQDPGSGLEPGLRADLQRIAGAPALLVALDFDGTLAPTVDDPDAARALPAARAAVVALAGLPATRVAVVSGRAIASLERVAQLPSELLLVGSHGAELRIDGEESGPDLSAEDLDLLGRLYGAVAGVATRYPGVRVEEKPAGCGLHTRTASPEDAAAVRREALAAVRSLAGGEGIAERYGKDILEFTVRTADKGTALQVLRDRTAASAVLFVGDDVTDEDGFAVLAGDDLGVKVGAGDTRATRRVDDPEAVAELLGLLVRYRERIAP